MRFGNSSPGLWIKGFVREGFHSEVERADRNISDEDIHYGLSRKDRVQTQPPERSRTGGFKYLIQTVDGRASWHFTLLVKPDEKSGEFENSHQVLKETMNVTTIQAHDCEDSSVSAHLHR